MEKEFKLMLDLMDHSFNVLEDMIPAKPAFTTLSFGQAYRYEEKNIHQAIIQKLARTQSATRAAHILLKAGHCMEQAILSRVID